MSELPRLQALSSRHSRLDPASLPPTCLSHEAARRSVSADLPCGAGGWTGVPLPSYNHPVKDLSCDCPTPGTTGPGVSTRHGKPGQAGGGCTYCLAFVFLLISRLVCLGGCFSPNTEGRRHTISPGGFHTDRMPLLCGHGPKKPLAGV